MPIDVCPVCLAPDAEIQNHVTGIYFDCKLCGQHEASSPVLIGFKRLPADHPNRLALGAVLTQAHDVGERILLTTQNADALAHSAVTTSVPALLRRTLEQIGRQSAVGGAWVSGGQRPSEMLRRRVGARTPDELAFLLTSLADRGDISFDLGPTDRAMLEDRDLLGMHVRLSSSGWAALAPSLGGTPGLVFVAMSFDDTLDSAWKDAIRPAIENDCKLKAYRVDEDEHCEQITDKILANIRRAECVVADFTGQRPGVYFEAGFALGLGRTVVWTCRDTDFGSLHFDTRQYNHIKWSTEGELRIKLAARLGAVLRLGQS